MKNYTQEIFFSFLETANEQQLDMFLKLNKIDAAFLPVVIDAASNGGSFAEPEYPAGMKVITKDCKIIGVKF